jgi:hypothetical protein
MLSVSGNSGGYAGNGVDNGGLHPWKTPFSITGPPEGIYATVALGTDEGSNGLNTTNYGLAAPSGSIIQSLTVNVTGGVRGTGFPAIALRAFILYRGSIIASIGAVDEMFPNGTSDSVFALSTTNAAIGNILTPAIVNDPSFGIQFVCSNVGGPIIFTPKVARLSGAQLRLTVTGTSAINFNYLKTFAQTDGQVDTLALDNLGNLWQEDVTNNPGTLTQFFTGIQPNTFAESATVDDREFIAFSNLLNGTDIPRTYDGTKLPRLSQVGPGAPPTASTATTGSAIVSIAQNAAVAIPVNANSFLLVSDSPSDTGSFGSPSTPGNVMTIVLPSGVPVPSYLLPGMNIVLTGFPSINGFRVNNDPAGLLAPAFYTVTTVGQPIPGQNSYDALTFTINFTTFYSKPTPAGCTYQATEATLTTAVQVPNLEVGDQFQITATGGAPPTGYDGTWTVDQTPNASQLQIVSTVLNNNVATYGFNLITGVAPVPGEAVTVANTLNGNGIFNVANAIITSVTAGTFSIALQSASNIPSAAEDGGALIFGTIFQFDPFAIVGNKSGVGSLVTVGVIAAGVRMICYSFLTENGYITAPSPVLTYDVVAGAQGLAISNLLTGPSNVIARIIHLTGANGGQFYNIPTPVPVIVNGQTVTYSSTYLLDNTSTSITLSFTDDVLTAATEIDVPGNNLFETTELGSCTALVPYAGRLAAIGEQNKIQNLLNYSFDGGVQVNRGNAATGGSGTSQTYPAGWTVDPVNGGGGSVVASPIFGNAYQIIASAFPGPSGAFGAISQNAYQDEDLVPIVEASTLYSVRVTASAVPSVVGSAGNLVIDLFSPSLGRAVGTFNIQLSSMSSQMAIYTGTMLTTALAPVPNDLVIRIYVDGVVNTWTVLIDRIEPFPTLQPNLSGQVILSYQGNFEAFDRVSGVINTSVQNQQPTVSAFTLFDTLYLNKSGSLLSVQDNKTTEPADWAEPRIISNVVGTPSIYGVAGIRDQESGEEWSITAGQNGAFVFNGGEPIKITEEIQELWDLINWQYGYTMWVVNDIKNRRILFGVPMKTFTIDTNNDFVPNPWLPPDTITGGDNPTTPNCIIALNYKFLTTGAELGSRAEIHVSSFGGKLLSVDMSRKWNIWTIQAPCGALITRQDTTLQTLVGNSEATGKIYQLVPGLLEDDGEAFWQLWTSHGWPTPEQEQGLQLGSVRKTFEYMSMILGGSGSLAINVFPDSMSTPYSHALLPNLTLPATSGGDTEVPVNEVGNRLFLQFSCKAVGAGFSLSRIVMAMRQEAWAPVRGQNS